MKSHSVRIGRSQRPLLDQHTTLTRERHPCPRQDSSPQSQDVSSADPRLKPGGHQDGPI